MPCPLRAREAGRRDAICSTCSIGLAGAAAAGRTMVRLPAGDSTLVIFGSAR